MHRFNVMMYGAAGNGMVNDTQAIQSAIDACAEAGGGIVYLPPGRFRIGTVCLRSNLTLQLDPGAVLAASTNKEDYRFVTVYERCVNSTIQTGNLYGKDIANVKITGNGAIEGEDRAFWTRKDSSGDSWNSVPIHYWPKEWRPMGIMLEGCSNVQIHEITILNSSVYSGWLVDCQRIQLRGLQILNDFHGPNTDGFHFSSCRDVHVADCHFVTGDDAIAIDADGIDKAENYTITNCTFNTSVNCFRIFTGLDPWFAVDSYNEVRNISISNCSVSNAAGFLNVTADNGLIEGITATNTNLQMEQEGTPIFLMTNRGTIRNVSVSHLMARSNGACVIVGQPGDSIDNIELSHIQFEVAAKKKEFGLDIPDDIQGYAYHHFVPYNLYFRYAEHIKLHNVSIRWLDSEVGDSWSALKCRHIERIDIDGFSGKQAGDDPQMPAISFANVGEAWITRSRALPGTKVFVQATGGDTRDIHLSGNDLRHANEAVKVDRNVPLEAIYVWENR